MNTSLIPRRIRKEPLPPSKKSTDLNDLSILSLGPFNSKKPTTSDTATTATYPSTIFSNIIKRKLDWEETSTLLPTEYPMGGKIITTINNKECCEPEVIDPLNTQVTLGSYQFTKDYFKFQYGLSDQIETVPIKSLSKVIGRNMNLISMDHIVFQDTFLLFLGLYNPYDNFSRVAIYFPFSMTSILIDEILEESVGLFDLSVILIPSLALEKEKDKSEINPDASPINQSDKDNNNLPEVKENNEIIVSISLALQSQNVLNCLIKLNYDLCYSNLTYNFISDFKYCPKPEEEANRGRLCSMNTWLVQNKLMLGLGFTKGHVQLTRLKLTNSIPTIQSTLTIKLPKPNRVTLINIYLVQKRLYDNNNNTKKSNKKFNDSNNKPKKDELVILLLASQGSLAFNSDSISSLIQPKVSLIQAELNLISYEHLLELKPRASINTSNDGFGSVLGLRLFVLPKEETTEEEIKSNKQLSKRQRKNKRRDLLVQQLQISVAFWLNTSEYSLTETYLSCHTGIIANNYKSIHYNGRTPDIFIESNYPPLDISVDTEYHFMQLLTLNSKTIECHSLKSGLNNMADVYGVLNDAEELTKEISYTIAIKDKFGILYNANNRRLVYDLRVSKFSMLESLLGVELPYSDINFPPNEPKIVKYLLRLVEEKDSRYDIYGSDSEGGNELNNPMGLDLNDYNENKNGIPKAAVGYYLILCLTEQSHKNYEKRYLTKYERKFIRGLYRLDTSPNSLNSAVEYLSYGLFLNLKLNCWPIKRFFKFLKPFRGENDELPSVRHIKGQYKLLQLIKTIQGDNFLKGIRTNQMRYIIELLLKCDLSLARKLINQWFIFGDSYLKTEVYDMYFNTIFKLKSDQQRQKTWGYFISHCLKFSNSSEVDEDDVEQEMNMLFKFVNFPLSEIELLKPKGLGMLYYLKYLKYSNNNNNSKFIDDNKHELYALSHLYNKCDEAKEFIDLDVNDGGFILS